MESLVSIILFASVFVPHVIDGYECKIGSVVYADVNEPACLICPNMYPTKQQWRRIGIIYGSITDEDHYTDHEYIFRGYSLSDAYNRICTIDYINSQNAYALVYNNLSMIHGAEHHCSNSIYFGAHDGDDVRSINVVPIVRRAAYKPESIECTPISTGNHSVSIEWITAPIGTSDYNESAWTELSYRTGWITKSTLTDSPELTTIHIGSFVNRSDMIACNVYTQYRLHERHVWYLYGYDLCGTHPTYCSDKGNCTYSTIACLSASPITIPAGMYNYIAISLTIIEIVSITKY